MSFDIEAVTIVWRIAKTHVGECHVL
jgi:hypothetical protein